MMFDVMNAMSDKVGPMQFTIGLSMRAPEDTSNVVTLAKAAHDKLGDRLDAMLLGNVSSSAGLEFMMADGKSFVGT